MASQWLGCGIEFQESEMNKKALITALFALVTLSGQAQEEREYIISGFVPEGIEKVYLYKSEGLGSRGLLEPFQFLGCRDVPIVFIVFLHLTDEVLGEFHVEVRVLVDAHRSYPTIPRCSGFSLRS